jgi:hypothetical protein
VEITMSKKTAFVRFAKAAFKDASEASKLFALKPWTWTKAEQVDADAGAVRAIAAAAGFSYGTSATGKKYSGLCIKKPAEMTEKQTDDYNAAKMALSRCRAQFINPKDRAAMTDWSAKAVSALVHLTPKQMQAAVRAAIAQRNAE